MEKGASHPIANANTLGIACLLFLVVLFASTGTLGPGDELPHYANSARQITGMALMLTLMPPYFIVASRAAKRRSLELVGQLETILPDARYSADARQAILGALRKTWPFGATFGIALGLLNTDPIFSLTRSAVPQIDISISFGQLLLWLLIGLVIGQRVVTARAFSRLGEVVEFDLFRLDRLRPLARSGMVDVVVIVGGLALSPLQSLDAHFRWYNYSFALMVSIPAAIFPLLWPLQTVHRRIEREKLRQLDHVEGLIEAASRGGCPDEVSRLETLLSHRDRISSQRTWPLSTSMLSRLFAYLIIPPLAWVGAAIVEMAVNRVVGP